ncbi:MAG: hypothetical protein NT007_15090 [Candidatus Kapabacteria bacterium]|nr:hypothetical protein [Candidatus Kapabacteria bacterium]
MSFPRMRESPSSANHGIPAFAGMTEIAVFTQARMRESTSFMIQ